MEGFVKTSSLRKFIYIAATTGAIILLSVVMIGLIGVFVIAPALGLSEISFDQKAATALCGQVVAGALKPDANGIIKLPAIASGLSLRGEAYSRTDASGTTWVLFRTWQGKGANLRGYLYRSTAASSPVPSSILVLVPIPQISPPTMEMDLPVDKQLAPYWYRVSFDLD